MQEVLSLLMRLLLLHRVSCRYRLLVDYSIDHSFLVNAVRDAMALLLQRSFAAVDLNATVVTPMAIVPLVLNTMYPVPC